MGPAKRQIFGSSSLNSQSVVCHKNSFENNHSDRRLIFKHGIAWNHRIKRYGELCLEYLFVCCLFIWLFIISEIHSHFSKRSQVDLHATG